MTSEWEEQIDSIPKDKEGWIHCRPETLKAAISSLLTRHEQELRERLAKEVDGIVFHTNLETEEYKKASEIGFLRAKLYVASLLRGTTK